MKKDAIIRGGIVVIGGVVIWKIFRKFFPPVKSKPIQKVQKETEDIFIGS